MKPIAPKTLSRREFGTTVAGLALAGATPTLPTPPERRCIFLWLTGGPSQLDTFDPKPAAAAEVRGPFRSIATRIAGVRVSELFPLIADRSDRIAFIRSMHHDAAPIHETGQQLLQTGRLCQDREYPHIGAAMTALGRGPWAILPGPLGDTGVDISHGQTAGPFSPECTPHVRARASASENLRGYSGSDSSLFANCMEAVNRIQQGYRLVVVNSYATVYDALSWDAHNAGGRLNTGLADYRVIGPMFDFAFSAVLDRLAERGLLDSTLVVAAGEFGRTSWLNPRGGRDHWPGVWTILLAGGGVQGGTVIGASDKHAAEPADRPVTPPELVATIYHALGVDPRTVLQTPTGPLQLADAEPIRELF